MSLTVRNRRPRWRTVCVGAGATQGTDLAADGDTLHRVCVDAAGNVRYGSVSDPDSAAQWSTWATIVSADAPASGDVALACPTTSGLRAFWINAAGTPLRWTQSSDGGATWASAGDLATLSSSTAHVAAAHEAVAAIEGGVVRIWKRGWGAGSWSVGASWTALGTLTTPSGLGVAYNPTLGHYYVVVAGDGRLWWGTWYPGSDTWSVATQIWPGSHGAAPSGMTPAMPAACFADGALWLSWIDRYDGDGGTWEQPLVCRSQDLVHFGDAVALGLAASTQRRAALAARSDGLYAANEKCACAAPFYDAADAAMLLSDLTPLAYSFRASERAGRLTVTLHDPEGALKSLGRAGETGAALQPLSELVLSRGYGVDGSPVTESLPPCYLTRSQYASGRNGGRLTLEATDGWGLLNLWHADAPLVWEGQTVRWLLAEIAARVGLAYADSGASSLGYSVPVFTLLPETSGAAALRALLRLAGAVARFNAAGALYAVELANHAPSYLDLGDAGELLYGRLSQRVPEGTGFRVYGDGETGICDAAENTDAGMALGLRLPRKVHDSRLSTATQAGVVGTLLWSRARMSGRYDEVWLPLRPDVELWDRVRLLGDTDLVPLTDCVRRVVRVEESYDGRKGQFGSKLGLERV